MIINTAATGVKLYKQKNGKVYVNPRGWLSKSDEKGKKLYSQISEVTDKYGNEFYLSQSLHPFDTQTNESLHQAQAFLTPKAKIFHASRSFHYRHAINIGCHNFGFDEFWKRIFDRLQIPYTKLFIDFVDKTQRRKRYWKEYQQGFEFKRKRAYKQKEMEKRRCLRCIQKILSMHQDAG